MNAASPAPTARARRMAWGLASLGLGAALGWLWLDHYGHLLDVPQNGHLGWIAVGLACLVVELPVRVLRTAVLLHPPVASRGLLRPILAAHAIDLLGPPLAGDVSEVFFVGRAAGSGVRGALPALLLRMVLTVAGLCLMAAGAMAHRQPVVALALVVAGLALAHLGRPLIGPVSRWLHRRGRRSKPQTDEPTPAGPIDRDAEITPMHGHRLPMHLSLALVEVLLPGFALVALAAGLGAPLPIWLGLATVAALQLLTYVPMPLGGIGLQHWGLVGMVAWLAPDTPAPALLAVAWHASLLAVAGLGGVFALAMGR